ncbi:MAG: FMN-binding protein [Prolixibacteraceae bacterium]
MFKLFFIVFSLWVSTDSLPPKGVDFEDKSLLKELQRASGMESNEWKDLSVPESKLDPNSIQGKFLVLTTASQGRKQYAYVGRVNSCRQGGCSNPVATLSIETPEYFDYLIVFDSKPSVQLVKVFNYQATHGQEISVKGWLKQFQGYDGSQSLSVGKDIDAISGATVSVIGISNDIQEKTRLLKKICQPGKN